MSNSLNKSKKSYFQFEHNKRQLIERRKTRFLPDGAYLFQDDLNVQGILKAKVITCSAWLLELYELRSGEFFFISGPTEVRPATSRFGVLYPPFTISQPSFTNVKARLVGVAATETLPAGLPQNPTIFETSFNELPTGVAHTLKIFRHGINHTSVQMNPKPSLLSIRAKRLIDENYLCYPSIARVAQRLSVTHEHLSRQFKRDFEISLSGYLHQLRLADAPLRLARGEQIINVSAEVGYNDLSRFYKQFRKSTKTSPGVCQSLMKPNPV